MRDCFCILAQERVQLTEANSIHLECDIISDSELRSTWKYGFRGGSKNLDAQHTAHGCISFEDHVLHSTCASWAGDSQIRALCDKKELRRLDGAPSYAADMPATSSCGCVMHPTPIQHAHDALLAVCRGPQDLGQGRLEARPNAEMQPLQRAWRIHRVQWPMQQKAAQTLLGRQWLRLRSGCAATSVIAQMHVCTSIQCCACGSACSCSIHTP